MKGTIPAHNQYFCSEHYPKKYEEKEEIPDEEKYCPSCAAKPGNSWYKERLFMIIILTIKLLNIGYLIFKFVTIQYHNNFGDFVYNFIDYVALIWWAILIGFLIGGIIDYFIPRRYIEKYLSRHKKRTILYSIVLDFL